MCLAAPPHASLSVTIGSICTSNPPTSQITFEILHKRTLLSSGSSVKRHMMEDLPWVGNALPASAAAELQLWSAWTLSVAAAGHVGAKRVAPFAGPL